MNGIVTLFGLQYEMMRLAFTVPAAVIQYGMQAQVSLLRTLTPGWALPYTPKGGACVPFRLG